MRRRQAPFVVALSFALVVGGGLQPAQAAGLISTEHAAHAAAATAPAAPSPALDQRALVLQALLQAGVEPGHAQARLAALTDAEVAALSARFNEAPAGGLWFAPFLVVAIVIGALIGVRSQGADASTTDLFGRPRHVAAAP